MTDRTSSDQEHREQMLNRVGQALRTAIQTLELAREKVAKDQKLHPTDLRCLAYLDRIGEPVSPKQIIAELGMTSGSGTALLDRLEKAHLIRRIPHASDRRSILIAITEHAAEPLARYREIEAAFRKATVALSDRDLMMIADFLDEMSNASKTLLE